MKAIINEIPMPVIAVVADVLGKYYYNHTTLNILFMENGAPGDPPLGNCVTKCQEWLKRCNKDNSIDAFSVLGGILKEIMEPVENEWSRRYDKDNAKKKRINAILTTNGLAYISGGKISVAGLTPATITLDSILRQRDLAGVNVEFNRALNMINQDPGGAVTASCAIIEALLKIFLEDESISMPSEKSIGNLWKTVKKELELDPGNIRDNDIKKILSGLISIIDGIGSLRTHTGSAHGQGRKAYKIETRHARLAVNVAHTFTVFFIEMWEANKSI